MKLHLGCGRDYRDGWHNVDAVASVGPDEVVDLDDTPWPWADDSATAIVAEHVFEHLEDMAATLQECARVLEPGARARVTMPMGVNAAADPDHEHVWTWQTPLFYCGERHWDTDVGLSVVDRSVSMHSHHHGVVKRRVKQWVWAVETWLHGPGEWCFGQPAMSGEFTVVFEA